MIVFNAAVRPASQHHSLFIQRTPNAKKEKNMRRGPLLASGGRSDALERRPRAKVGAAPKPRMSLRTEARGVTFVATALAFGAVALLLIVKNGGPCEYVVPIYQRGAAEHQFRSNPASWNVTIAQMTDLHLSETHPASALATALPSAALAADIVVATGDIFDGCPWPAFAYTQWRQVRALFAREVDATLLTGNHDGSAPICRLALSSADRLWCLGGAVHRLVGDHGKRIAYLWEFAQGHPWADPGPPEWYDADIVSLVFQHMPTPEFRGQSWPEIPWDVQLLPPWLHNVAGVFVGHYHYNKGCFTEGATQYCFGAKTGPGGYGGGAEKALLITLAVEGDVTSIVDLKFV